MVRKSFISCDSNSGSYNHMGKEVEAEAGSDEAVLLLRNGESEKLKDKLCYGGGSTDDVVEMVSSWLPRLYTCSFCKRRFKSAQALGGHMNVHRRARAMLRSQSSSPWLSKSIITSADHNPFQHDEHHFIYPNPNPHWPLYMPQYPTTNPSDPSNLSMVNLTPSRSLVTITPKSSITPSTCNCKHMLHAQYHHAELTTRERVKNNCISSENQLNGLCSRAMIHQDDDMVSSRPADAEDIDLELRIGF